MITGLSIEQLHFVYQEVYKVKQLEILNYLEKEIHSVIIATVDDKGLPVTCAIDIMDSDEKGLYFLTAKEKGFMTA